MPYFDHGCAGSPRPLEDAGYQTARRTPASAPRTASLRFVRRRTSGELKRYLACYVCYRSDLPASDGAVGTGVCASPGRQSAVHLRAVAATGGRTAEHLASTRRRWRELPGDGGTGRRRGGAVRHDGPWSTNKLCRTQSGAGLLSVVLETVSANTPSAPPSARDAAAPAKRSDWRISSQHGLDSQIGEPPTST